jgi:Ca2+-binding RTX toxin-like protein
MSDSMHAMSRLKSIIALSAFLAVTAAAVAIAGAPIICTGGPCTGTPGNDDIAGSANDDQIRALAGNDSTQGGGGDDTHIGGLGNDELSEFGGDGNGGRGRDTVFANPADDVAVDCERVRPPRPSGGP